VTRKTSLKGESLCQASEQGRDMSPEQETSSIKISKNQSNNILGMIRILFSHGDMVINILK